MIVGGEILLVLRIIIGIGQGIMFPACNVLLSSWTPPTERSIMVTLVFAGAQVRHTHDSNEKRKKLYVFPMSTHISFRLVQF